MVTDKNCVSHHTRSSAGYQDSGQRRCRQFAVHREIALRRRKYCCRWLLHRASILNRKAGSGKRTPRDFGCAGSLEATPVFLEAMRIFVAILFLALSAPTGRSMETGTGPAKWEVYFSPRGGCTEAVVDSLGKAKSNVLVQAYSFTSAPIAKALVEAHRRGVKVEVVLDRSQRTEKYSSATFIFNNGIPCFIDSRHAIAHNKVLVIDGQTVITGSFNFTKAAEDNNAENLLVIQDRELAAKYAQNWSIHREHSEPYTGLPGREPRRRKPS
jgi:phosphatidylserine/phosphatidylglycerophosphate/cardiolipin synthase-like enzyme